MAVPWKNWCRLCASPNGGVPIVDPDGGDHFLSEKIRKYLSISVSEEDKVPSLLCSECCDQLAAFDNFFHHCLQVQAMFCALCELEDDNVADERLYEIRKEFLPSDVEVLRDKFVLNNLSAKINKKKITNDGKRVSLNQANKECSSRKQISIGKVGQPNDSNVNDCRKSKRLKEMAEIKRAFGEVNETFTDTLDSDFNEDSFENLLDSDDSFQPVLRNSKNGLKAKEDFKIIPNSFSITHLEQAQSMTSSKESRSDKCCSEDRTPLNTLLQKKEDCVKLRDSLCNNELSCDVLSSEANGTSVNSLSDTDINDIMCGDNSDDDTNESDTVENNNHSKEYKLNGIWRNQEKEKCLKKSCKTSSEKIYELDKMFEEPASESVCGGNDNWNTSQVSDQKLEVKKKDKPKDQSYFKCEQCDKSFPRKALLNVHLISHMPKDQQPYVCCKCARRFHCESLLRNHERVHLPNEEKLVFPCHVCNKKFSSRSAVTAHLKAIHFGERPFVCHLCGHSFSSKGILQEHLLIHSDEEPWQCTKCSKRFKTKYRLKIHMDTHRETPYSCPHCPIQLSTRRTLRMHLVVHRDTRAYQCSTCGKAFRRAKDLKNHLNLHTGRKPYICPFCSRTFANGSNCRSHKRRMHPEELRLYEAALAGNGCIEPMTNPTSLETGTSNNNTLLARQDLQDEENQSMKEDSQESLLTEMALDLQHPSILTVKSSLATVHDDPVVTAADLTLAPLVTLSSTLPKMEPDDSRLVMNLTTQIHETNDSMDAMSPLNLNIMSPMNLNISSPLNLNISSPLNLNISSGLHSPTGRNQQQQQNLMQSQHHQNSNRYQPPPHHQTQQQLQHLTLQPAQHQMHHQPQLHHQQVTHQTQLHQQMHQQQLPRSTIQMSTLQTSLSSPSTVHSLSNQTQLPAHLNNTSHHVPQNQTFVNLNQQSSTLYGHHTAHTAHVQDSVSSAALMAAAAMAHSMSSSSSTTLPPFGSSPYTQHSMAYGRGANM